MQASGVRSKRHDEVLNRLKLLPRNIIMLYGMENLSEFLLHTICYSKCFNINKAAYFVDNPDFDHLKGITGFHHKEAYDVSQDHWVMPDSFSLHMRQCMFNQKVRDLCLCSNIRNNKSQKESMNVIAQKLEFENPSYISWDMKYDNHGLLIFEQDNDEHGIVEEHLNDAVYFLGLSPVF